MTIPSWASVGRKIAYVGSRGVKPHDRGYTVHTVLEKGAVCTVRATRVGRCNLTGKEQPAVKVVGFSYNGLTPSGARFVDAWINLTAFRPLVDDSDEAIQRDVALFSSHLQAPLDATTVRKSVDA